MALVRPISFCGLLLIVGSGCQSSAARLAEKPTVPTVNPAAVRPAPPERQHSFAAQEIEVVAHEEMGPSEDGTTVGVLSLARLIEDVQAVHPSVAAMYATLQAAQARYPQVVSLDDPMFGATVAPASFGSRDVESAYALEASQKFPWHGKRALRGAAANSEA
ncbi:MAG: hypothetical protein AB7V46_23310, partial [Thermomicrobiales bacterium]